jgi:hypothetical protein
LETLTREGWAGEFLAALAPAQCHRLADAVANAFAVPALRTLAALPDSLPAEPQPMPQALRALVNEPPPRLPPAALAFWACCILLVRHPAAARTAAVRDLINDWLRPASGRTDDQDTGIERSVLPEPAAETVAPLRAGPPSPAPRPISGEPPSVPRPAVEHEDQPPASVAVNDEPKPAWPSSVTAPPVGVERSEDGGEKTQSALEPPAPIQQPRETEIQAAPLRVRTTFGGIFYLLNVALDLGIYSDFTRPRGTNLALSPFDWLALLGRHWFADELEANPLWPLLAVLAGRAPAEPPGLPEGIADPQAWLARESERVHQRLVAGLPEKFARGLPDCVCRQDADVCVSQQRVEVRFALATHPLALRLSGLDRDPGWLPAAGREIAFNYD